MPDLRGFGDSPVTPHLVTMRQYAADIGELLDDLGIMRAAVVGLSMGGLVTMELATSQPERYWAIGLVATTAEPVTQDERVTRRKRADAVERDGMGVLVDYMHTGLYGPACPPAVRTRIDTMMSATSPAGAAAALRGRAARPDYRPLLAGLDIPALVCAGSEGPWSDCSADPSGPANHEPADQRGGDLRVNWANADSGRVFCADLTTHFPQR